MRQAIIPKKPRANALPPATMRVAEPWAILRDNGLEAQQLHLQTVAADEAVEGAVGGVHREVRRHDGGEPLYAGPHVLRPAGDEEPVGRGEGVQSDATALSTIETCASEAPSGTTTSAPLTRTTRALPVAGVASRPAES